MASSTPTAGPSFPPIELKAKRTHARRSCDLCKLRKTRCELPDLDVVAGPEPQPVGKSCHRCQVLSLPCVVDDAKKQKKEPRNSMVGNGTGTEAGGSRAGMSSGGSTRPTSPKRRKTARTSLTDRDGNGNGHGHLGVGEKTLASIVNDSLEMTLMFDDELDPSLRRPSAVSTPTGFGVIPDNRTGNWQVEKEKSMKYLARPYELVAAMLTVAYGRRRTLPPRVAYTSPVDIDRLLDVDTRQRLEPGFNKLRTFHPHLGPMSTFFGPSSDDAGPGRPLLTSLVIYLSSLAMPAASGQYLREILTPYIYVLRDAVLQELPANFNALQALEIFAVHAPFGILPFDSTRMTSLALNRGTMQAASAIAIEVSAGTMVRIMLRLGHLHAWLAIDAWTWLSTCAAEAYAKFENEVSIAPPSLAEATAIASVFYEDEDLELWRKGVDIVDEADFIGRLYMCDRILQLAEVLDSLARSREIVEAVAKDPTFDATAATLAEFKYSISRLEALDNKFHAIYIKSDVVIGWLEYRQLQRRYAAMKIYVVGIRSLMAAQFVHDPNTPQSHSVKTKVTAATARAFDPTECMPLLEDGYKDYTRLIWEYGRVRNDLGEQVVASSAEMLDNILRPGRYSLAPMIDTMCLTIESSKISVEAQAWKIAVYRIHRPTLHEARYPAWVQSMRSASTAMVRLSTFTSPPAVAGQESISHGCAGLMASMSRIGQDRSMMLDLNPETASDLPRELQVLHQELDQPVFPAPGQQVHTQDTNVPTLHQDAQSQVISGQGTEHGYMNTSDRWMATGTEGHQISIQENNQHPHSQPHPHPHPHPQDHPHPYPQQYDTHHPVEPVISQPPVMIDRVLSEAFWYNYQPPARADLPDHSQQPQQQPQPHPPQQQPQQQQPHSQLHAQGQSLPAGEAQVHHPNGVYGAQDGLWQTQTQNYNA